MKISKCGTESHFSRMNSEEIGNWISLHFNCMTSLKAPGCLRCGNNHYHISIGTMYLFAMAVSAVSKSDSKPLLELLPEVKQMALVTIFKNSCLDGWIREVWKHQRGRKGTRRAGKKKGAGEKGGAGKNWSEAGGEQKEGRQGKEEERRAGKNFYEVRTARCEERRGVNCNIENMRAEKVERKG